MFRSFLPSQKVLLGRWVEDSQRHEDGRIVHSIKVSVGGSSVKVLVLEDEVTLISPGSEGIINP